MVRTKIRVLMAAAILILTFSILGYAAEGWRRIGPEGGYVNALAIDPTSPRTLYAGTLGGSVFKSTNGGESWNVIGGIFPDSSIVKLIVEPTNPKIIYAATNARLLRSTDGGETWTDRSNGLQFIRSISTLEMDPLDPQILYVGNAQEGFYRTLNAGYEWADMSSSLKSALALAIDPNNTQVLYASRYFPSNDVGWIYRSADRGDTWVPPQTSQPTSWWNVGNATDLLVDPSTAQTVYLASDNGVYRTTDGGIRWNLLSSFGNVYVLAMDPNDAQTLYAGTLDAGIYRTSDGGGSWTAVNSGLSSKRILSLAIDPEDPAIIYAGTSAGIFKSINAGASWRAVNSGLRSAKIAALAIDPSAPQKIYASSPEVGVFKTLNGGSSWSLGSTYPVDASFLAVDSSNSQNIYALSTSQGLLKSANGGAAWTDANAEMSEPAEFLTVGPAPASTLYAGSASGGIFKSTDSGRSWNSANSGITAPPSVIAVDPGTSDILYAGTKGNAVFKSTDGSVHWETAGYIGFGIDKATLMVVDPSSPETLYVATSADGLFKSTDFGIHWEPINSGLSTYVVTSLQIHAVTRTLYVSTSGGGIFKSTDGGSQWTPMNTELGCLDVSDLKLVQTNLPVLYASTNCGVWAYSLPMRSDVSVGTSPAGLTFSVDGTAYYSTASFSWEVGSSHTIYVPTPQFVEGARYALTGWSDGGATNHVITVQSFPVTYTAAFATEYRLTANVSSGAAGRIEATPASTGGYYTKGTVVQLQAVANEGFTFSGWNGDLAGTENPQSLEMSAPHRVTANFEIAGRIELNLSAGGAAVSGTTGAAAATRVGYAALSVDSGSTPYGTAIFSFRKDGVTVSEAAVPASPPTSAARIFIDYRPAVSALPGRQESGTIGINTGIAVTNGGSASASITYTLRGPDGTPVAVGHGTIGAGDHFACFIDQFKGCAAGDFEFPSDFGDSTQFGSLEINSTQPVSILALRGTNNQRGDFLMTTTPVADLTESLVDSWMFFPQFVDGLGYTTSLILINTSDVAETGVVQFIDKNGDPLVVSQAGTIDGSSVGYSIPAHGVFHFQTAGTPDEVRTGWARVIPDAQTHAPAGSGVFGYNPANVLVSESGIPSVFSTTHARLYVDLSKGHNTGLAVANITDGDAEIAITAFEKDGVTVAGNSKGPISLLPNGHNASFANQLVDDLPEDFTGVLDVQSSTPFAALTLRSLNNERGEFLMTTFPIADATRAAPSPIVFPRIADGGGYITEIMLISAGDSAGATLELYDEDGTPFGF